MIRELQIENFKSISKLKMSLGRVNVLIGENGSGKSNILEAIAMASAAAADKLDHEFLSSRGIRVPEPQFMRAAFEGKPKEKNIKITLNTDTAFFFTCSLQLKKGKTFSGWVDVSFENEDEVFYRLRTFIKAGLLNNFYGTKMVVNDFMFAQHLVGVISEKQTPSFFIYSPENTALRVFQGEGQLLPLGIRGEGLLSHLKALSSKKNLPILKEIESKLSLLNWFEGLKIPAGAEPTISIKDRNLPKGILFDQRSANEGFLFLLFYFTLFISPDTPDFFAIDNIDASLNPKLCATLLKELVGLAEKHNKQVILTTHNPALLDGLDLTDPEQKLFAIERNRNGHTRAIPIEAPVQIEGMEPTRLSESFIRGSIGGLPKNF